MLAGAKRECQREGAQQRRQYNERQLGHEGDVDPHLLQSGYHRDRNNPNMHEPWQQRVTIPASHYPSGEVAQQSTDHITHTDNEKTNQETRYIGENSIQPGGELRDIKQSYGDHRRQDKHSSKTSKEKPCWNTGETS